MKARHSTPTQPLFSLFLFWGWPGSPVPNCCAYSGSHTLVVVLVGVLSGGCPHLPVLLNHTLPVSGHWELLWCSHTGTLLTHVSFLSHSSVLTQALIWIIHWKSLTTVWYQELQSAEPPWNVALWEIILSNFACKARAFLVTSRDEIALEPQTLTFLWRAEVKYFGNEWNGTLKGNFDFQVGDDWSRHEQ